MKHAKNFQYAPIALFLYDRPSCAIRLFDCLAKSEIFTQSSVYVFIDGPTSRSDSDRVDVVQDIVSRIQHSNLEVISAGENKGLKKSILDGVSLVLKDHDRVIVLEDDLEFAPVALEYLNRALIKYANSESVYSVCGYLPGPGLGGRFNRAVILPYTHSWGWATWSRAWREFEIDLSITSKYVASKVFREAFSLGGLRNYGEMLQLANLGAIDSWYIYWYFHVFRKRGVSIFPPQSYFRIRGSGGTHSNRWNPLSSILSRKVICEHLIELPDNLDVDYWVLDMLTNSFEAKIQRLSGKIGSIRRKLVLNYAAAVRQIRP